MINQSVGEPAAQRRSFPGALMVWGGIALLVTALVYTLLYLLSPHAIPGVLFSIAGTGYLVLLLRWLLREYWAGPLLIDLGMPKSWWHARFLPIAGALMPVATLVMIWAEPRELRGYLWCFCGLCQFGYSFITNSVEARENGILVCGSMVKWNTLKTHVWESTTLGVVRLRPISRISWFKPVVPVPLGKKDALVAILAEKVPQG
jgi:hypothetical protein